MRVPAPAFAEAEHVSKHRRQPLRSAAEMLKSSGLIAKSARSHSQHALLPLARNLSCVSDIDRCVFFTTMPMQFRLKRDTKEIEHLPYLTMFSKADKNVGYSEDIDAEQLIGFTLIRERTCLQKN
jgi:hypothetical protein